MKRVVIMDAYDYEKVVDLLITVILSLNVPSTTREDIRGELIEARDILTNDY